MTKMSFKKIAKRLLKPNNKPNMLYRLFFYSTSHCFKRLLIKKNIYKNDKVLDIGGRRFTHTKYLNCQEVIGIDILSESGGLLGWTSELLEEINQKDISLYIANAEELPFPSSSIDKIILIEVIEHIENDEKAISEISRVLKNNGKLILSTPNGKYVPDTDPFHLRHYNYWELEKLLNNYFKKVHIWTKFPWLILHEKQIHKNLLFRKFYIIINKIFEFTIGRFIRGRGYTLFAVCEEPIDYVPDLSPNKQGLPIVCPICKGDLLISSKVIKCQACNRDYSYYNQIPEIPVLLSHIPRHQVKEL